MAHPRPSAVRRRVHRLVGVGVAATAVLSVAPPAALAATPAVEGFAPYVGQVSCDPSAKPGTLALARHVLKTYGIGRSGGTVRACSPARSEHMEGRAWDWMLSVHKPAEKAAGDAFSAWLTDVGPDGEVGYNARRLGVMYIIWDKKQWSAYRAEDGWLPYRGASAHTDHVHLSLSWNGAMGRTSFWTGTVSPTDYGPCRTVVGQYAPKHTEPRLTPCPAPKTAPVTVVPVSAPAKAPAVGTGLMAYAGTTLRAGSTGEAVTALQQRLGLPLVGKFGPATHAAVVAFQKSRGLTADGVVGRATWAALAGAAAPAAPAPVAKPVAKPVVATPVKATPAKAPAASSGTGLMAYAGTTLRRGSKGEAVKALQYRLRLPLAGNFGPATHAAVVAFQKSRGLTADGVVGRSTWAALAGTSAPAAPVVTVAAASAPAPAEPAAAAAAPAAGLLAHAGTVLRFGSKGEAVKALQYRLRLPLAGNFGPATKAAVVAFQRSRGLTADGVVGAATWKALAA